jgi:hypothetical protein
VYILLSLPLFGILAVVQERDAGDAVESVETAVRNRTIGSVVCECWHRATFYLTADGDLRIESRGVDTPSVLAASMSRHIINGSRLDYSGGMHKGASRVFFVSSYSSLASMIEISRGEEKQEGSRYRPP